MIKRYIATLVTLAMAYATASAQIDAILDLVFDAVEPTPVYDLELKEATENLASKIDRLNNVLFGGAEQTSAAYRYRTMYSDLYDLTSSLGNYVEHQYNNAKRLERLYSDQSDDSVSGVAYKMRDTWAVYEDSVSRGKRIIEKFKRLFSDSSVTNAEVRQAARQAIDELNSDMALADSKALDEYVAEETARELVECAALLSVDAKGYVSRGKKLYGTSINSGGNASTAGTFATAVMIIIGLLCALFCVYAATMFFRQGNAWEVIARLVIFFILSLIVVLSFQQFI